MKAPAKTDSGPGMTLEEWSALPEDADGELVDGRLVEEEMPDWIHAELVAWLIHVLLPWVDERGGRIGGSGARIAIAERRGRRPDIVVFLRNKPPARGLITVTPDIVVEIVSATPADQRRDRVEKLPEYAGRGIAHYLLVDPALRTFEVLRLGASGLYEHALSETGGVHEIPGCPGLTIDLDAMWHRLDALEDEEG